MDKALLQNIDAKLYEVGGWIVVEPDNAVWERGEMIETKEQSND